MGDHGSYTTNPLFSESLWDEWNWIDSIEFALEWSMEGTSYRPHSASVLQKSETIIQPRPFIASKNGVADSSSNIPIISAPKPVESVPMPFSSGLELPPLLLSSSLTTLTADEILSLPFPGPLSNTDYCGSNCSSSWSHATSSLGGGDEMEEREEERVSSVSLEGGSRARQESISSLSDETLERSSHVVANDISIPPTDFEKSLAQVLLLNGKPVKKDPQFSCPVSILFDKTFFVIGS